MHRICQYIQLLIDVTENNAHRHHWQQLQLIFSNHHEHLLLSLSSSFTRSLAKVCLLFMWYDCVNSTITSVNEAYCDQTLANGEHIQRTLLIASNLYLCLVFIIILIAGKPLCIPSHISACTLWLLFILRVLSIWLECMAFVNCSQSQQTVWI